VYFTAGYSVLECELYPVSSGVTSSTHTVSTDITTVLETAVEELLTSRVLCFVPVTRAVDRGEPM